MKVVDARLGCKRIDDIASEIYEHIEKYYMLYNSLINLMNNLVELLNINIAGSK